MDKDKFDIKYLYDLLEYWDTYMYFVINEIYIGIGISLGLHAQQAYDLAKNKNVKLQKSNFFKNIFEKFKNIFKYKIPSFRIDDTIYDGKKIPKESTWEKIYKSIDNYWKDHTSVISEDMALKGFILGRNTTDFRKRKKPYQNKSLYQINFDQYNGNMPNSFKNAYKEYDFTNSEKIALNKSFSSIGMHVSDTNNEIKDAIRKQIQSGIDNNKTPIQIASDLYWEVEKNENLVNQYTAESIRKNWHRIAQTELAAVHEAGILSPYESDAMESLKNPSKAQYFVFTGGTCPWCRAHQGVLTRLVPFSIVKNAKNDSLSNMGIKDPNTDIAIWIGKDNIGYKETKHVHEWRVTTPAHPYNVATMQPIDIETEFYNKKTGKVEKRQEKQKFIPQEVDYSFKTKEEKEYRKPTYIGPELVRYNNNIYQEVSPSDYEKKLEEYKKNVMLPIPVSTDSTRYDNIFGEAKKNK